ncbi:MAG TPA: YbaY family lipoprotein [Vicinamibacterales bacterium]|nr:YbaY family lipoprotein [Vicinamibacterales bacterium]
MNHDAVAHRRHVINAGGRALARLSLAVVLPLIADQAMAQTVTGSATYRERMAMPAGAVFEATIEDVSKADAPALVIASTRNTSPGNPPVAFSIAYDKTKILPDHRYVVRARILVDGKLMFTSDVATPVITRGAPTTVSLMLRRAGGGPPAPPPPASAAAPSPGQNRPLAATYWKAIEIAGKPVPAQSANREAHLSFQPGGRVTGSDGCNKVAGTYTVKADAVTFGQMVGTQMACTDSAGIERAFQAALRSTTRWRIAGDRLELLDAAGKVLAAFQGRAPTPRPAPAPKLAGTTWQLVKVQGGDGTTLTPDDKSKYVI